MALIWTLGLMRVRALTFDRALELLRRGATLESPLKEFIYQVTRKELGPNDVMTLTALSFFVPSASFEALMHVANLTRTALEIVLERLNALALVDILPGEERYSLHPITRGYIRDELLTDTDIVGTRFARYWIDYAKENEGKEDMLEKELPNLKATVDWLTQISFKDRGIINKDAARIIVDFANAAGQFLSFNEHWDVSIQLNTTAYEAALAIKEWNGAIILARNLVWGYKKIGQVAQSNLWRETIVKMEQKSKQNARVFLSYAREDREQVRLIYKELKQAEFLPWVDVEDLKGGQDWELEIEKAIKNSDFVLVCLSNLSTRKQGYIQKEIKIALDVLDMMPEGGVYLIPVRLDTCAVPSRLSKRQWIDLFEPNGFDNLKEAIRAELERRQK